MDINGCIVYGVVFFTPSVVKSFGFDTADTQLMTIPPVSVDFVLGWMSLTMLSVRIRKYVIRSMSEIRQLI